MLRNKDVQITSEYAALTDLDVIIKDPTNPNPIEDTAHEAAPVDRGTSISRTWLKLNRAEN